LFSLAFSILILAQTVPSIPATAPSDVAPIATTVETAPTATQPASTAPALIGPATQPLLSAGTGTLIIGGGATTGSAPASAPTSQPIPWWAGIRSIPLPFLLIPIFALMLIVQMRNKKRTETAQKERLNAIKRGDRVQTIGGIIGNVVQAEESRILIKVDESNNTKIWFARSAVGRVLGEEKTDGKTTK